jgi:phosphoribosylaminoimidazole (AIR) synthetase
MQPTVIYSCLLSSGDEESPLKDAVKSMAHVTGGGINRAIGRLLPAGMNAEIDDYDLPEIYKIMINKGIEPEEMKRVFNMGWGMLIAAEPDKAAEISQLLGGRIIGNTA